MALTENDLSKINFITAAIVNHGNRSPEYCISLLKLADMMAPNTDFKIVCDIIEKNIPRKVKIISDDRLKAMMKKMRASDNHIENMIGLSFYNAMGIRA